MTLHHCTAESPRAFGVCAHRSDEARAATAAPTTTVMSCIDDPCGQVFVLEHIPAQLSTRPVARNKLDHFLKLGKGSMTASVKML
jgi:hypothetical protein